MGRFAVSTPLHLLTILLVAGLCTLPNLGAHTLWDVDDAINAEAAREMLETGSWITPLFNYELRTAKPAMLYWWQMASYSIFGVSEWSARLPSVLAGLGSAFLTYFLASRMFGAMTGLTAAVLLVSCLEFCMMSHSASPDAVLVFFLMLAITAFWKYSENGGRGWFIPMAAACGGAVLTKGPVGVALPGLVVVLFFAWNRELKRLLDRRMIWASIVFIAVAAPWYGLVALETRGQFVKVFIGRENMTRFLTPMENHSGFFLYHFLVLFLGFAPGSVFLLLGLWEGGRLTRQANPDHRPYRFLACWFGVYMIIFSVAATKLPNYALPLYPAVAILCGRLVERWRLAILDRHAWLMKAALGGFAFIGCVTIGGLLVAGGAVKVPYDKMRIFEGLSAFAWIGVFPLSAATLGYLFLKQANRNAVIGCMAAASVLFTAALASLPIVRMNDFKAPEGLVKDAGLDRPGEDIRLASLYWFRPSVVFYVKRGIKKLEGPEDAAKFLATPRESFLFVDEPTWREVEKDMPSNVAIVAERFDFLSNKKIYVIANRASVVSR